MKLTIYITLLLCSLRLLYAQNPKKLSCIEVQKDFKILNDSGALYTKKKFYITANSYFKAAQQLKELNDSCNLANNEESNIAVSIVAPATYQKLIERVLDFQDAGNYFDATEHYKIAGTYYSQFQIAEFGLVHDSLLNFVFTKCKTGFAAWLSDYYFHQNKLDLSITVYKFMLEKGYDYKGLKRQFYDLGIQLALRDKLKNPTENAKHNFQTYALDKPEFKYLKMGYLFGWK